MTEVDFKTNTPRYHLNVEPNKTKQKRNYQKPLMETVVEKWSPEAGGRGCRLGKRLVREETSRDWKNKA